ncbi:hypothetical protein [Actinomadura sp. 3N407]|uniref:hypothetical protein n=1 Tax=Actinomadura sp. 3N407 TaxID=3457423 RepID=UPI003FCCC00A
MDTGDVVADPADQVARVAELLSSREYALYRALIAAAQSDPAISQTLVTRRPRLMSCGTRVHTIPVALATSIAATRATTAGCPRQITGGTT